MGNSIYVSKWNNHYEYFVCNLPDDGDRDLVKISISEEVIAAKAFSGDSSVKYVSIDNTSIKKIEQSAFEGCRELRILHWNSKYTLETPSASVQGLEFSQEKSNFSIDTATIQKDAFKDCRNLQTVIFPEAKEFIIEKNAFAGCPALRTVIQLCEIADIADDAFLSANKDLLTFIVYDESSAERFARENGIRYITIGKKYQNNQ